MFDIGFLELLIIGIVALIVVGPKDLPGMFRTVGRFMGKARGMAREFQRSMEAAADESGLNEATQTLKAASDPLAQATRSAQDYTNRILKEREEKEEDEAVSTSSSTLEEPPAADDTKPAPSPEPAPAEQDVKATADAPAQPGKAAE